MKLASRVVFPFLAILSSLFLAGCGSKPSCSVNITTAGGSGANGVGAAPNSCDANGGVSGGGGGSSSAFVYYLSGSNVAAAGLQSSGSLLTLTGVTAQQAGAVSDDMAVVNKKFLYIPFGDIDAVQGLSIGASGALTSIAGSPFALQSTAGADAVVSDPQGRFLFIGDETHSTGSISVFQINGTTGALTEAPGSPFLTPGVFNADSMAVDGAGKFLYVAQGSSSSPVVGFSIDQNTGALSPIVGGPFFLNVAQLHADSSGKFLLGVQQIQDGFGGAIDKHIYVFSIDPTTGTPTAVPGSPFATVSAPFDFAIHPNGQFVYITGNDSTNALAAIEGYQLDPTTGALTALTGSPFSTLTPSSQCRFDESGGVMICATSSGFEVVNVNATTGAVTHSGTDLSAPNYPFAVTD